jgi:hypothetical protein
MTKPYTIPNNHNHSYTIADTSPAWTATATIQNTGKLKLSGSDADVLINDVSLKDTLAQIQQHLAILVPHPELERDFEQLTHLRNQYDALAQELREKKQAWDLLKNTDQK